LRGAQSEADPRPTIALWHLRQPTNFSVQTSARPAAIHQANLNTVFELSRYLIGNDDTKALGTKVFNLPLGQLLAARTQRDPAAVMPFGTPALVVPTLGEVHHAGHPEASLAIRFPIDQISREEVRLPSELEVKEDLAPVVELEVLRSNGDLAAIDALDPRRLRIDLPVHPAMKRDPQRPRLAQQCLDAGGVYHPVGVEPIEGLVRYFGVRN
jgi:hypothetical protein